MRKKKYDPILVDYIGMWANRTAIAIICLASGAAVPNLLQSTGIGGGENRSSSEVQSQAELGRRADRFEDGLSRWHEWFLETQSACLKAGAEYEGLHNRQNQRLGGLESRIYRLENE